MNMRPLRASSMIASVPTRILRRCRPGMSFPGRLACRPLGSSRNRRSLRKLFGWSPAARARPERLIRRWRRRLRAVRSGWWWTCPRSISHQNVMKQVQRCSDCARAAIIRPIYRREDVDLDIELSSRHRFRGASSAARVWGMMLTEKWVVPSSASRTSLTGPARRRRARSSPWARSSPRARAGR